MAQARDGGDDPARRAGEAHMVRQVFDQMPLAVVAFTGPDLRMAAITAAYRELIGRQDAIGRRLRDEFAEVTGQQTLEIFERVHASGQAESVRDFRVQINRPDVGDQVELFVDFTISSLHGPDGEVVGVIAATEDVTARVRERQAAQAQVAEAQRRYERARDLIDALQRELLPAGVPVPPGVEIAASYLLADEEDAAGGDWFDALVLDDGRIALAVGDVVGHGVAASATMGQLRMVLRERLAATGDQLAALDALNKAAAAIPRARAATVCILVLDPQSGEFTYTTAGHPPPLLIDAAGQAGYLPPTGAGPIGVGGEFAAEHVNSGRIGPGGTALLYTDGILERPGRELAQASVELAQVAGDIAADRALREDTLLPAERMCTRRWNC